MIIKAVKAMPRINIKGAVDDIAETVSSATKSTSKSLIDIKSVSKPNKITIKTPAQQTFEEGVGANILAEQNRTLISTRQQAQAPRTSNPIRIRNTSGAYISPHTSDYQRLCSPNMTLAQAEELSRLFYEDTGLILHCPTERTHLFSIALDSIYTAVKQGKFPKDIKHVLIGHGMGSSQAKTWAMEGLSLKNKEIVEIFPYINKTIPKGEKVLVCSCESPIGQIASKPGIGNEVQLSLGDLSAPGKVVRSGIDRIIGHYTITDGFKPYEIFIKPKA